MATRPIFIARPTESHPWVDEIAVQFEWHAGFSISQAQKSIESLHVAAAKLGYTGILEISSKSRQQLGVSLSAFNLRLHGQDHSEISVECAFQGSKVFQSGGPFTDLYQRSSREAKVDPRLRESGLLTGFRFMDEDFPTYPLTAFYDWLYLRALRQNRHLSDQLHSYHAFSDIAFNPQKSFSCQARSAALYVALSKSTDIDVALEDYEQFIKLITDPAANLGDVRDLGSQLSLPFK